MRRQPARDARDPGAVGLETMRLLDRIYRTAAILRA
jgi:hypothetical protein